MLERLELIEHRYKEINNLLTQPDILSDVKTMTTLMKELKGLEETVVVYKKYKDLNNEIADLHEMTQSDEKEIVEMAHIELEDAKSNLIKLEEKLKVLLIPVDPNDEKNVIFEIRGAAGGDEGNIFAGDLFRMYMKYAEAKGWKIEMMTEEESEMGGFSQVEFMMKGENVYSFLKYESGAHRVQRAHDTHRLQHHRLVRTDTLAKPFDSISHLFA